MSTPSNKYVAKKREIKSIHESIQEDLTETSDSGLYYKAEIEKSHKNFVIIFQYLKSLCYYPEFEYSGLLDLEEIERWERTLESLTAKKQYLENENNGKLWELRDFYHEMDSNFKTIYKYNIKLYLKILKFKLEDIYQYLDVQRDGDMLALQSFKMPGGDDVISLYDIKREAMNIIHNKLDKFGKNLNNINKQNITVYNTFLEKTNQFISEFSYYETDGMDRNILFSFINEIYTIIPD